LSRLVHLVGRSEECAALYGLLESARQGLSGTLVIRGDAGIGKTALIDEAIKAADDFLVVRFTGVESEHDLAFAALHRLLTPILHQIARLPTPQRDALNSALGLTSGPPADRFLVGLGVISLAANAARAAKRLLCVIDDAQWVDRESLDALAFWGRRIHAEGIALVFAERDESPSPSPLDGFAQLHVGGLQDEAARTLVLSDARLHLDREVLDRIVADMGGNPLALLELATRRTPEQIISAVTAPLPLPLGERLEAHYMRQVRALPVETQMVLLLVAAESSGDAKFLRKVATLLGTTVDAAEAAEAAGLLSLDSPVKFRHPLIRAAVYGGARPADRRAVHRALAAATDDEGDVDRMAWHLAAATIGGDEEVAVVLERSADRAGVRGGHNARAALLTRAAELTPDPESAARRRVDAAAAALAGGSPVQTHALLELASPNLLDPTICAIAKRLEGSAWILTGHTAIAAPILLSAGEALLQTNTRVGRDTLLEALQAAFLSGHLGEANDGIARAVAKAASSPNLEDTVADRLLDSLALYVTSGYVAAVEHFRSAIAAMLSDDVPPEQLIRWSVLGSSLTRALWDQDAHDQFMRRVAHVTRERGALPFLAVALEACATSEMWAGHFSAADAHVEDAIDVYAAAGFGTVSRGIVGLDLAASRGRIDVAKEKAGVVMMVARELGMGSSENVVDRSLVVLALGTGEYADALKHASALFDRDPLPLGNEVLPDMIEAAVRTGDLVAASKAMERIAERAPASGTPWAMGLLARSRALLAEDEEEPLYRESIELLGSTRMVMETARSHLLFGEWLRRQGRRIEARDELRIAFEMFDTMGAEAFAGRSRVELLATGEHARRRNFETATDLTPQEAHVARLAADGHTNGEIAARMYISASTVEYHLHKVYRKLDVTSRRRLKEAIPADR
jgi:DNA-binding CsgD family transcriptional regulator